MECVWTSCTHDDWWWKLQMDIDIVRRDVYTNKTRTGWHLTQCS